MGNFKNITYIDIKHMLINYYTPYFDSKSFVTKLEEKWNREEKIYTLKNLNLVN